MELDLQCRFGGDYDDFPMSQVSDGLRFIHEVVSDKCDSLERELFPDFSPDDNCFWRSRRMPYRGDYGDVFRSKILPAVISRVDMSDCSTWADVLPKVEASVDGVIALLRELHEGFVAWHRDMARRVYKNQCRVQCTRFTEERFENYLHRADMGENVHPAMPSRRFFLDNMLGMVVSLACDGANSLEDLFARIREVSKDAIQVFGCMMRGSLCSGTQTTVHSGLIHSFFRDTSDDEDCYYHDRVYGQFKRYYAKYGKDVAKAIAIYQGYMSDYHFDGGDYSEPTYKIDMVVDPVCAVVPREFWGDVFQGFINMGAYVGAWRFLQVLPSVVCVFQERGKQHLLPWYFAIVKAGPEISPESSHNMSNVFPVHDGAMSIEELEGLEAVDPEVRGGLLGLACSTISSGGGRGSFSTRSVSFIGNKEDPLFSPGADNLSGILTELQKAGKTPQDINRILAIPDESPWLGRAGISFVSHYNELDRNFPGGAEACLLYLKRIASSVRAVIALIDTVSEGELPHANVDVYLEAGVRLVDRFGDAASHYFKSGRFKMGSSSLLFQKLADDPAGFLDVVDSADAFVSRASLCGSEIADTALDVYFDHWGLDDFEAFIEGLECLIRWCDEWLASFKERDGFDGDRAHVEHVVREIIRGYAGSPYSLTDLRRVDGKGRERDQLLAGYNWLDQAAILMHMACVEGDHYLSEAWHPYVGMVRDGVDYRVAARVRLPSREGRRGRRSNVEVVDIPGIEPPPLPDDVLKRFIETVVRIRAAIDRVYDRGGAGGNASYRRRQIIQTPKKKAVGALDFGGVKKLRSEKKAFERLLREVPRVRELCGPMADDLLRGIDEVLGFAFFKEVMGIGFVGRSLEVDQSPFLAGTNLATRMALCGTGFMVASGMSRIDGLSDGLEPVNFPASGNRLLAGPDGLQSMEDLLRDPRLEAALRRNLKIVFRYLEDRILRERLMFPGLLPIGGKLHTKTPMNLAILDNILRLCGFDSTSFSLLHAGHTLVLPPMVSSLEIMMLVRLLDIFGVLDMDKPEIQTALAGRLDEQHAPFVGAGVLLATRTGTRYKRGAFSTTHDSMTGARIMAFDSGVKIPGLPFDVQAAGGRTDVLGRRDPGDFWLHRVVGSAIAHHQFGGPFASEGRDFANDFTRFLNLEGLLDALWSSAWVLSHARPGDSLEGHEAMVGRFTGAWMDSSCLPGLGVISGVNRLIHDGLVLPIAARRDEIAASYPEEMDRLRRW